MALDTRLVGEAEARRRILGLCRSGLDVHRIDDRFVVRFREPIRVRCEESVGSPFVRIGGVHATAPLEPNELPSDPLSMNGPVDSQRVGATGEQFVIAVVEQGAIRWIAPSAESRIDPADWLDVSAFSVVRDAGSLGQAAPPPVTNWLPASDTAREVLGVPPLGEEGVALLSALAARSADGTSAFAGAHAPRASGVIAWMTRAIGSMLRALGRWWSARERNAPAAPARLPSTGDRRERAPAGPSWMDRARRWLSQLAVRSLVWSRLGSFIGRQHAKYLSRMLEMFDDGDLDQALRHAIPLGDRLGMGTAARLPLLPPGPRADLAIVPGRSTPGSALGLGTELFDLLRRKYRQAFDVLVARGEFEKAAFVLAELLDAREEAVAFLEQHGRLKLAAEIAEARNLAPGLVVRQWFLAGDRARAIRIARRTGAYADAVLRLERTHPREAEALRLLWADTLASAGAYAAAVRVLERVEGARNLAMEWMNRAIAVGGVTGAGMLLLKLRWAPQEATETRNRILALLEDDGHDVRTLVEAIGSDVLAHQHDEGRSPSEQPIAREVARRLLAGWTDAASEKLARQLVGASGDSVLRADWPTRTRSAESNWAASTLGPLSPHGKRAGVRGELIRIRAFCLTDVGKVRTLNEDTCVAGFLDAEAPTPDETPIEGDCGRSGILLGVFDGFGGHAGGDWASEAARRAVWSASRRDYSRHAGEPWRLAAFLLDVMRRADREIFEESARNPDRRGHGCTSTIATSIGSWLLLAQMGDTRGYLLREGRLVQVTRDHTLLNMAVDSGQLVTPEEIEAFEHKTAVVRALGMRRDDGADYLEADVTRVELRLGDVLLLCTDGLSSVVPDARIRDILVGKTPAKACHALLAAALQAGAPDNVSIVVAQFDGDGLLRPDGARVEVEWPSPRPSPEAGRGGLASIATGGLASIATGDPASIAPDSVRRIHRSADDVGAIAVHDAAELPDGRLLVALGEIGARLYGRDGKVQKRFVHPVHQLVMSDHGDRAILVARRGEACRLAKLDLLGGRAQPWCDARIDTFAPDFDGESWYVGSGDRLFAIDALSTGWEHLSCVDADGSRVLAIARDSVGVSAWVDGRDGDRGDVWTFEEPGRVLRARRSISSDDLVYAGGAISSVGAFAGFALIEGVTRVRVSVRDGWRVVPGTFDRPFEILGFGDGSVVFATGRDEGIAVHVFRMPGCVQQQAELRFDFRTDVDPTREQRIGARFQKARAVFFDTAGRVLTVSSTTADVIRDLRVT